MTAVIYTNDFNRMVEATKKFVAKFATGLRVQYGYIRLQFDAAEKSVTAAAVDGYRLSIEHSVVSECDEDFVAYIRPSVKLPSGKSAQISIDGDEVIIRCDGIMFGYKQPSGEFLRYEDALPKSEVKHKIAFNANYLLEALQAAKASNGGSLRQPLVLEFRGPLEPVIIRTNKEDIKMVLPVRIKEG